MILSLILYMISFRILLENYEAWNTYS